jgi:hypothetical protein
MFRLPARFVIISTALLTMTALSAYAEDRSVWTGKANGGLATLSYGSIDLTKSPEFLLSCFNGMGIAVLDIRAAVVPVEPGKALAIQLLAGTQTVEIKADGASDGKEGTLPYAEASDVQVKPILAVLGQPGPVTLKIGDASVSFSDLGRSDAVKTFSEECAID